MLTRWLDLTNTSEKPVSLTAIFPWSTRLWADTGYKDPPPGADTAFRLGYFTRHDWGCEGWFEWEAIAPNETKTVACDCGQGYADPFFFVDIKPAGAIVIGHLA